MKSFTTQTHYEVLEVSVSAKRADIEAAYERLLQLYDTEQVALYGLVDAGMSTALRKKLKDARDTLADDDKRDAYDAKIGLPPRDGFKPKPVAAPPVVKAPVPSAPSYGNYTYVIAAPAPQPSAPSAYTYVVPAPTTHVEPVKPAPPPPPITAPLRTGLVLLSPPPPPAPPPTQEMPIVVLPPPAPVAEAVPPPVIDDTPRIADEEVQIAIIPARATPARDFRLEPRPKPYDVPPDVEFNGDLLKQVRMARGLSLAQVSERTRIGMKHLENLEGDRYDALPAGVYLRGMLMSLARELGLDGLRVSKSYMTFVDAHRAKD